MKTIENKCEHKTVRFLGMQETGKETYIPLANCYYCKSTITITDKYRNVIGKVYEKVELK